MNNASRRWARVLGPAVVALAIGIPVQQASAAVTAPKMLTAPTISPTTTPTVGQLMSTTSGTWSGTQPITYKYQWQRCSVGGSCNNISGATTNSYTPTTTDKGKQLRSRVIADNAASGTKTAYSARTAAVVQVSKPGIITLPKINSSPAAVAGNTLQLTHGTWTNSPTSTTDSWQRCNGSTCTAVGTGATYLLSAADVGKTIKVVETAMNGAGSTSATSQSTGAVADSSVVSPGTPTITPPSPLQDGSQLTAQNPGPWGGTNVTLTYNWETSPNGNDNWQSVQNTASATYTAVTNDVTDSVRVTATGHNSAGDVSAGPSNVVGPVSAAPIVSVQPPSIGGGTQIGQTLTATQGVFSGTNPSAPSYTWWSCPQGTAAPESTDCGLPVSTDTTYLLQQADQNNIIFLTDTRTGDATPSPGVTGTSAATAPIAGLPPQNTVTPTIDNLFPLIGQTLTVTDPGTWSTTAGPLTYTYQWWSCDTGGSNCTAEPAGGTGQQYLVRTYDVGRTIEVTVTATDQNSQQGTSPNTAPTAAVTRDPNNSVITVANWAMDDGDDGTMHDTSGYGNVGQLFNVGIHAPDSHVPSNSAYSFPLVAGTTSNVVVANSASLNPDGVNDFNISLHVKITSLPDLNTVGDYDLMRKGQSTDSNDWKVEILSTGVVRCYLNDGAHSAVIADAAVSNAAWGLGTNGTGLGTWVTITCTFTKNSVITRVYSGSGSLIKSATTQLSSGSIGPVTNPAALSIGSKTGGPANGGDQYTGKMDQVVITSG